MLNKYVCYNKKNIIKIFMYIAFENNVLHIFLKKYYVICAKFLTWLAQVTMN